MSYRRYMTYLKLYIEPGNQCCDTDMWFCDGQERTPRHDHGQA
jgi:hypothetical protein